MRTVKYRICDWHATGLEPFMKFRVEFGEIEKQVIEYEFNQLFGRLRVTLNDQPVMKRWQLFNEPVREVLEWETGEIEKLQVRIVKERGQLYGQTNRVFINNRLVKCFSGK